MNRRCSGPNTGCYGCGDPDHFVAHCPKKNKQAVSQYDYSKRKGRRDYTATKPKGQGGFDKEALKKAYLKKLKAQERAFLASLSDLNDSGDERFASSDNDPKQRIEDKLNGVCFFADSSHGGFCTMALEEEVVEKNSTPVHNYTTEVLPSIDSLS